jgi:squalene-hopene/tetraprenyl-beta-curcumene cyclase
MSRILHDDMVLDECRRTLYRVGMTSRWTGMAIFTICAAVIPMLAHAPTARAASPSWNARAAAAYLDGRQAWWQQWPNAARDHDTACVSCHTALPYALARPALRRALGEQDLAAPERTMITNVVKRVKLWKDVEPFYPDQTRGLPKSSESRGTEAILNAAVLVARDVPGGALSDDARQAFTNLWALQFKNGDLKGAWAWLNFHYEPWESNDGAYYGATLAALAVGHAPGGYAASPDIQDQVKLLREYLQKRADTETIFNRVMVLWASAKMPGLLTADERQAIIDTAVSRQQDDGGWTMATLGSWKRVDATALDTRSDGYATGLVTLVLQQSGVPLTDAHVGKGLAWLASHQDATTGMWSATSLNKQRDPATDIGKFMSDAATAYAVLALTQARVSGSSTDR